MRVVFANWWDGIDGVGGGTVAVRSVCAADVVDISTPSHAVLIKDDYERYYKTHADFVTALSGDLIEKTFLFLGFSFTDPNIDYILSRIRTSQRTDGRAHYCLMRKAAREASESEESFAYRRVKQELFITDLKRFQIHTIKAGKAALRRKDIFPGGFKEVPVHPNYEDLLFSRAERTKSGDMFPNAGKMDEVLKGRRETNFGRHFSRVYLTYARKIWNKMDVHCWRSYVIHYLTKVAQVPETLSEDIVE